MADGGTAGERATDTAGATGWAFDAISGEIITADGGAVALLATDDADDAAEYVSRGRLLAAAPDLLAALRHMRANYALSDYPGDQQAREMIDAAIAKAEGRS